MEEYVYCNYCERIFKKSESDWHVDFCGNFESVTEEEYQEQIKND